MSIVNTLLLRALVLFLMLGSVAGLFAGVVLVLRPDWLLRVSKRANQWVSTRQMDRSLERGVNLDRWFYRYHRVGGSLTLSGAVFLIYFFTSGFDKPGILVGLSKIYAAPPAVLGLLLDTFIRVNLIGAVFVLIISLFLLFRPSLLCGLERSANQWYSMRRELKPLEISRSGVDEYVFRNIRLTGVLLLFGSLYALAGLAFWLG